MTRSNARKKYAKHRDNCGVPVSTDTMTVIETNINRKLSVYQCPKCGETFEFPYMVGDVLKMAYLGGKEEQRLDKRGWF